MNSMCDYIELGIVWYQMILPINFRITFSLALVAPVWLKKAWTLWIPDAYTFIRNAHNHIRQSEANKTVHTSKTKTTISNLNYKSMVPETHKSEQCITSNMNMVCVERLTVVRYWLILPKSFRMTLLALGYPYDCLALAEASMLYVVKCVTLVDITIRTMRHDGTWYYNPTMLLNLCA